MAKRRRAPDRRPTGRSATTRPAVPGSGRSSRASAPSARTPGQRPAWLLPLGVVLVVAVVVVAVLFAGGFKATGAVPSPSAPASAAAASPGGSPAATSVPSSTSSGAPVIAGIPCDVDEGTTYHVHSHLNIRFDGALQAIPAGIGITDTCLYWLHTHAAFGVIHIEAPAAATFTLGQFFDVWGKTLSSTQVLDRTVGPGESLYMYVNGQAWTGSPRDIPLADLETIDLQIGPSALAPIDYTWPPDFE